MSESRPGRLGVGVIGAGRVGAVLGNALRAAGHAVVGVSAISQASRDRAELLLPGVPILEVAEVVERAELVLLAVPDDALPELVSGLATVGAWQQGQLVAHTCGGHGAAVLRPALDAGAIPLALHPAMTFTGTSLDVARLVGCPFAVTAPTPVLPIGQALVVELGGEPLVLPEAARPLYHAAMAHAANHLVTVVSQAQRVLAAAGVAEPERLLGPLTAAAADGVSRHGESALTGPVARGDAGTIRAHLASLARAVAHDVDLIDVPEAYRTLSRATAQRALASGRLSEGAAQAVLDALDPEPARVGANTHVAQGSYPRPSAVVATSSTRPAAASAARPLIVRTRGELARAREAMSGPVAVVMTMGALHEGHLALVRRAASEADHVIVTIFVNPLQFGEPEDLARYPRTLEADVAALAALGEDAPEVVFAPEADEVYSGGQPRVSVNAGILAQDFEGEKRPGHFDGVLTVVLKLINLVRPDVAVFGQKDAQQLAVIRAMAHDLDLGVRIVAEPTVRDLDGLALSSRNVRLSPPERAAALALHQALQAGARAAEFGGGARRVLEAARTSLVQAESVVRPDYLAVVDPTTMAQVADPDFVGDVTLVVAAQVGTTRLIDNEVFEVRPESSVTNGA